MKPFSPPAFRDKFGVARRDITPPLGIYSRSWGAATFDIAESVHRPLTLTALTIQNEDGGEPLAILVLDLGWWARPEEMEVLSAAVKSAGVSRFILSLTHTHSGPAFSLSMQEKPGGALIRPYLESLAQAIEETVSDALKNAQPGIWEAATGFCGLASNRDLPDPERDRLLVGWNPENVADETLLLGRISNDAGTCLATIVNYACHPTILAWENKALSPDYIGAMREVIEKDTGAPCLFLQGASGELAARHQYVGDTEVADRAGRSVGHAALGIFHGMLPPGDELAFTGAVESGTALARWETRKREEISTNVANCETRIDLPLRKDFPNSEEAARQIKASTDRVMIERLQRLLGRRHSIGEGDHAARSHQLWRLGNIFIVAIQDEAYSAMQIELRKTAGTLPVYVVTVANGNYLSPRHSFATHSYTSEVSPYAEGCFEQTLALLQSEIKKLL